MSVIGRNKWLLLAIIFSILFLGVVAGFLYFRLEQNQGMYKLDQSIHITSPCDDLPLFEFLHLYDPINKYGGRFGFDKIAHLCLERIEPVTQEELHLYLSYNTGNGYASFVLPARIMVSTQIDPTRHGPVKVLELPNYLGTLPARVSVRVQYALENAYFDPVQMATDTRDRMPSWSEYDWETYYSPMTNETLNTETLSHAMTQGNTDIFRSVIVMDVDLMRGL